MEKSVIEDILEDEEDIEPEEAGEDLDLTEEE